ncbi:alpha/beta hydrolase [Enterococcus bulliens]
MFHYQFRKGKTDAPVLVLLHGTGGDEFSLLPLHEALDPNASILSIRGNVLENGAPRFFKRLAEGVYDEKDLHEQGEKLADFLVTFFEENQLDLQKLVFVGYSNGANIALKLLIDQSNRFKKGILFHPMYPVKQIADQELSQSTFFVTLGTHDPIVPVKESEHVLELLENRRATVTALWTHSHQLTYAEVEEAKNWLQKKRL